jgi:hypothetical protein
MNHQWPPEVTRAMHEFSDAAPVAPSLTSVLEHRPTTNSSAPIAARFEFNRLPAQFTEEEATMIDIEAPSQTDHHRRGPKRVLLAALVAAAAVVAIALVAIRKDDPVSPADQPSPTVTVTVPPTTPPQALFGGSSRSLAPGTYFLDEVEGTPTTQILVTVGAGWSTFDNWAIVKGADEGQDGMTFSRPPRVFLDACHPSAGDHPGPLTTLDGLVAALREQGGWIDVTTPSEISIDGYAGKAFQRAAPTDTSDCGDDLADANLVGTDQSIYQPGETSTVWVLDLEGTTIVLETRVRAGQPAEVHAELAAMLDSIRIAAA